MQEDDTQSRELPRSEMFLLRIWQEELGDGEAEWRGHIRSVHTDVSLYFRTWDGLVSVIQKILEGRRLDAEEEHGAPE